MPFANDSNTLDKGFYNELLHILGLEEKGKNKKLIGRKEKGKRDTGSLLENTIIQLESLDKLSDLEDLMRFGNDHEEQLFNVALELNITWMNRILFLKLLEAQLLAYHKSDRSFSFLNHEKIQNFGDLNALFFQVLNQRPEQRNEEIHASFSKVPYLNSSLFETTALEKATLVMSNLRDDKPLPYFSNTVLKDGKGKKVTGKINAIKYLFRFLDSYDFSSECAGEIQEENKTLINASVLGLIFEKINGYKDGSFFTLGFITMYMCKETIRRAVAQKFKEQVSDQIATFHDVKAYTHRFFKAADIQKFNKVMNGITICDPAVGSGHFLVSALNEIIAIKSELGILADQEAIPLKVRATVENDELTVVDENGKLFYYQPASKESQRVQEALFHEKQTLIENCLFGVDINNNSVKICRLRLWIELLKNAYYTKKETYKVSTDGSRQHLIGLEYGRLETLPNIDINIKCGNSLISRFALDVDLKKALKKKGTVEMYRNTVAAYRNTADKAVKKDLKRIIDGIKSNFSTELHQSDPLLKNLNNRKGDLHKHLYQTKVFGMSDKEKAHFEHTAVLLTEAVQKAEEEVEAAKNNPIYHNAFEWRFEFPEVLNDNGDFVGFDVVIGNPPYGLFNKKQNQKIALSADKLKIDSLKKKYPEATGGVINAARIFYAFSFTISSKSGHQCMIIPYGILTDTTSVNLRKHVFKNHSLIKVEAFPERDNTKKRVFEDVKMSTAILLTSSIKSEGDFDIGISYKREISSNRSTFKIKDLTSLNPDLVQIPLTSSKAFKLLIKIYNTARNKPLGSISPCLTGEVDMTFGKPALTNKTSETMLIKGVQIDRFIMKTKDSQISQGKIEFINRKLFVEIGSSKKITDSKQKRIVLQGLTGVNEHYRLKATCIPDNVFLANSCNYLLKPKNHELELILGWLNSSLINFIFKTRSTNSNVNGYEVDNLPFLDSEFNSIIQSQVNQILLLKKENPQADTSKLETEIDQLVYQLYGLTEEEIAIVEGHGKEKSTKSRSKNIKIPESSLSHEEDIKAS